jgi:hypothetical protein
MSDYQNAGQKYNLSVDTKSFENVAEFKYLEMAVTNEIAFTKKLKSVLNSGMFATIQFKIFCLPISSLKS